MSLSRHLIFLLFLAIPLLVQFLVNETTQFVLRPVFYSLEQRRNHAITTILSQIGIIQTLDYSVADCNIIVHCLRTLSSV